MNSKTIPISTPFQVPLFSDVHFNPFFDQALFPKLFTDDILKWPDIFEHSGAHPVTWGDDSDYRLFTLTLETIALHLDASPFVIYTGDLLSHFFAEEFKFLYAKYQRPRDVPKDELDTQMKLFADKTISFLTDRIRKVFRNIPVLFVLGNCDSYEGFGPDSGYLSANADAYHSLLSDLADDCSTFYDTFRSGGYYAVDLSGANLSVICLNTIAFSTDTDPVTARIVKEELDWFTAQVSAARASGRRIWLLMHVPPGVVISETVGNLDANGKIAANNVAMMWKNAATDPVIDTQSTFLDVISHAASFIDLTLAGHTHMDEYRTMFSTNSLMITPGITPYFDNNPAFKILSFNSQNGIWPTNYDAFSCDLGETVDSRSFQRSYRFWDAYVKTTPEVDMNQALRQLTPELQTDMGRQHTYRENYYSGHNPPPPEKKTDPAPITDLNWPVFWSGIDNLYCEPFVTSVNDYVSMKLPRY